MFVYLFVLAPYTLFVLVPLTDLLLFFSTSVNSGIDASELPSQAARSGFEKERVYSMCYK